MKKYIRVLMILAMIGAAHYARAAEKNRVGPSVDCTPAHCGPDVDTNQVEMEAKIKEAKAKHLARRQAAEEKLKQKETPR